MGQFLENKMGRKKEKEISISLFKGSEILGKTKNSQTLGVGCPGHLHCSQGSPHLFPSFHLSSYSTFPGQSSHYSLLVMQVLIHLFLNVS